MQIIAKLLEDIKAAKGELEDIEMLLNKVDKFHHDLENNTIPPLALQTSWRLEKTISKIIDSYDSIAKCPTQIHAVLDATHNMLRYLKTSRVIQEISEHE